MNLRNLFCLIIIFIGLAIPIISFHFGVTSDEVVHQPYGWLLRDYYLSFGKNDNFLNFSNLYLYGGLFDTSVALIQHFFSSTALFEIRHLLNSLTGVIAILFCGLLAKEIAGWRAGILALIFLTASPRFFAHSMNNPKDIPFAAAYIIGIYGMVVFFKQIHKPDFKNSFFLVLGIIFLIGIKVGGLLLICYLLLFSLVASFNSIYFNKNSKDSIQIVFFSLSISALGYLGGLFFWPYSHSHPFTHPFLALKTMSHFPHDMRFLFEGKIISSLNVPWYYILKWIVISVPIFVPFGLLFFFFYFFTKTFKEHKFSIAITLFSIIFPLTYVIITKANLYNGWRHMYFLYPPIIVLAAISWDNILQFPRQKLPKIIVYSFLFLLIVQPIKWMVKNHPYGAVYFNSITGGVDGAFGNYEIDYWGNSLKECTEWLLKNDRLDKSEVFITSIGQYETVGVLYYLTKRHPEKYFPYHPKVNAWDYALLVSRGWNRHNLLKFWPPQNTIHKIFVENTIIAVVVENKQAHAQL